MLNKITVFSRAVVAVLILLPITSFAEIEVEQICQGANNGQTQGVIHRQIITQNGYDVINAGTVLGLPSTSNLSVSFATDCFPMPATFADESLVIYQNSCGKITLTIDPDNGYLYDSVQINDSLGNTETFTGVSCHANGGLPYSKFGVRM